MTDSKQFSPSARAYATSLMELAGDTHAAQVLGGELNSIGEVLDANPTFVQYITDPSISHEERGRTVKTIFGGRVSPLVLSTLGVLNGHAKLSLLPEFIKAYDALLDEKLGKIEVDVTTASPLSASDLENVRHMVNTALKKDAVIHQYTDESLIGGLVLKVGDQLIDGSVKAQLEQIKRKLLTTRSN